ncbi:MAG: response regulator [Chloroflexi bacterium]|nr:response regulator [Chloroflexota bacterium]
MDERILVVDDEIDTLNLLRTILEISGFEPITTLNSIEAISIAEKEKPDVALLDIMMPKLDGFTLCRMMRVHPATHNLPIIFVTAYQALDIEDRRLEAGADMVISKPIDMDLLLEAINEVVAQRRLASGKRTSSADGNGSAGAVSTAAGPEDEQASANASAAVSPADKPEDGVPQAATAKTQESEAVSGQPASVPPSSPEQT